MTVNIDVSKFGEGFWIFSEILVAYTLIVAMAVFSGNALAIDGAKVLGGAVAAWGAQWFATRGQTSTEQPKS